MKKLTYLMLISILAFSIISCTNDDKSDSTPQVDPEAPTIESVDTKLGETAEKTIVFTNPYNMDAEFSLYLNMMSDYSPFKIIEDKTKTTCQYKTAFSNEFTQKLKAGEFCQITYTFTPTQMKTEKLKLDAGYSIQKTICPTPETKPTQDPNGDNAYTSRPIHIYRYVIDEKSRKSPKPEDIDVRINGEYFITGNTGNIPNLHVNTTDFTLNMKKGEYTYQSFSNGSLKSADNSKCEIIEPATGTYSYTLNVKGNSDCPLKFISNSNYGYYTFIPQDLSNPEYSVNLDNYDAYSYNIIASNAQYAYLSLNYNAREKDWEDTSIDVAILTENEVTINFVDPTAEEMENQPSWDNTQYQAGKDKFMVTGTKHESCQISGNKVTKPQGKEFCLYTVTLTDKAKTVSGKFMAKLQAGNETYIVKSQIDTRSFDEYLQNACKEYHEK